MSSAKMYLGLAVHNAAGEVDIGEAGKHDGVHRSNSGACKLKDTNGTQAPRRQGLNLIDP